MVAIVYPPIDAMVKYPPIDAMVKVNSSGGRPAGRSSLYGVNARRCYRLGPAHLAQGSPDRGIDDFPWPRLLPASRPLQSIQPRQPCLLQLSWDCGRADSPKAPESLLALSSPEIRGAGRCRPSSDVSVSPFCVLATCGPCITPPSSATDRLYRPASRGPPIRQLNMDTCQAAA